MTRGIAGLLAALLLAGLAGLAGCGKYGPPVRAGAAAPVASHDAAACNDPAHDHAEGEPAAEASAP